MQKNVHNAKAIIRRSLAALTPKRGDECGCGKALKNCVITDPALMPQETKHKLRLIIEKYVKF
jgi:5'-methylthioadenosine phosphorylase